MKPDIKEFQNDEKLKLEAEELLMKGIKKENIYVLSHDDDRTQRVAKAAGVNTIGLKEQDLTTSVKNVFNKKGDELRNKLEELGFSPSEASFYEERLDQGIILLMVTH